MHEGVFQGIETFRRRLAAGEILIGSGISLTDSQVTDAIASVVDFLWIDDEHSPISPETLRGHLLAARAHSTAAVVRVPYLHTAFIKNTLDTGAPGIIGPVVPSDYGRDGGPEYVKRANKSIFVCPQIEAASAVDEIEEIVAVPGIDSIALGPYDLAASFGHVADPEHPTVVQAIEHVINTSKRAGLFVGSGMPEDVDYCKIMAIRGVQWLQVGNDYRYMTRFVESMVSELRSAVS